MRYIALLTCFLLLSAPASGSGFFLLRSERGVVQVVVNGVPYHIDSAGYSIRTRYPKMDVLSFPGSAGEGQLPPSIFCNFKPDSSYTLALACCGELDIFPTSKWRNNRIADWASHEEFDKIKDLLLDKPSFTLRVSHTAVSDTIYAWHADAACQPTFARVDEKGWRCGTPPKCFYWSNISTFVFFTLLPHHGAFKHPSGILEDVFPPDDAEILQAVTVRLFGNGQYVITCNVKRGLIEVKEE